MSEPYEENYWRSHVTVATVTRHELICQRLRAIIRQHRQFPGERSCPAPQRTPPRCPQHRLPRSGVVTAATGKVWLIAEVVSSEDHHVDTVDKKQIYEAIKLPRLWMVTWLRQRGGLPRERLPPAAAESLAGSDKQPSAAAGVSVTIKALFATAATRPVSWRTGERSDKPVAIHGGSITTGSNQTSFTRNKPPPPAQSNRSTGFALRPVLITASSVIPLSTSEQLERFRRGVSRLWLVRDCYRRRRWADPIPDLSACFNR